ncbi:signal peptidase [Marmoricola sp. OAE513]|uniref:signal peptidase I n=1 Tax=Marmoricola sp. OAE513 TaxID=2817894 RepID=UPI001AE681A9
MSQHRAPGNQADKAPLPRRVLRWVATLALVVVMLGCVAWMAPALFGYDRYVITGGSMTGTYDKGSIVFEKKVPVSELEVGDVITYLPPADSGVPTLVTHRILKMEPAEGGGTLFTTKGDANAKPDPWHFLLLDQKQPVVEYGVPHAGWIFIALADRKVRMLVIGLPAALIALGALGQLVGGIRGRRLWEEPTPASPSHRSEPVLVVPPQRTPDEAPDRLLV